MFTNRAQEKWNEIVGKKLKCLQEINSRNDIGQKALLKEFLVINRKCLELCVIFVQHRMQMGNKTQLSLTTVQLRVKMYLMHERDL